MFGIGGLGARRPRYARQVGNCCSAQASTLALLGPFSRNSLPCKAACAPNLPITGMARSAARGWSRSRFKKRTALEAGGSWSLSTTCTALPLAARSSSSRSASLPCCAASACGFGGHGASALHYAHAGEAGRAPPDSETGPAYFVARGFKQPQRAGPAAWVVVHHQHGDGLRLQARLHGASAGGGGRHRARGCLPKRGVVQRVLDVYRARVKENAS